MRTAIKYIFAVMLAVAGLSSCLKEERFAQEERPAVEAGDDAPVGKVKVRFTVGMPQMEAMLATKTETRDSIPNLNTMHVAVFGSSGYLKQYAQANLVSKPSSATSADADAANFYNENEDPYYTYEVELWLTNSSIKVHFIGNGPETLRFDYEASTIPEMYKSDTDDRTDAYWQRIIIPNGIRAKAATQAFIDSKTHVDNSEYYTDSKGQKVYVGDYIDVNEDKITNGTGYVVAQETQAAMSNVKLIRNFSQIVVDSNSIAESNFQLISYTLVNEPKQGTIAPYGGEWLDYLAYSDASLSNAYETLLGVYKGSQYINTTYDKTVPAASAFSAPDGNIVVAAGGSAYLYERPEPKENPTCIIVYGLYDNPKDPAHSNTYCYYKIDLMEKGVYLTLFRNFRYKVTIKHVNKVGKTTPAAAYAGAGSGDVSADADAVSLTDISDGECQLYVTEMMPILVEQYDRYEGLMYKFVYDITGGDTKIDNNYCEADGTTASFTINEQTVANRGYGKPVAISFSEVGSGNIIESFTVGEVPEPEAGNYYRPIYFKTKAPSGSTKTETFRITATYVTEDGRTHTLYRDIQFTLLNTQKLHVQCIPDDVENVAGQKVKVRISIPQGLPRAMFPLQFPIEIVNNSLGPDYSYTDQTLPVTYGQTYQYTESGGVKTRKNFNGYYFVRTLSREEYEAQDAAGNTVMVNGVEEVYFDSYFVTTKDESGSDVYVGCFPPTGKTYSYFEPNMSSFTHYTKRNFTWDTNYSANYFWEADKEVTLTFRYNTEDIPENLYVKLNGALTAEGVNGSNLTQTAEYTTGNRLYKVSNVGNTGTVSIKVKVADVAGLTAAVTLSANHYETNTQCTGTTGRWNTFTGTVNKSVTFTRSTDGNSNPTTKDNVRIQFSGSYYSLSDSNNYYRVGRSGNGNNTGSGRITITDQGSRSSFKITKVTFNYTDANYANGNISASSGTCGAYSNGSRIWPTGNTTANSGLYFDMTNSTSGGTRYPHRLSSIKIDYSYYVTNETTWVTTED